MGGAQLREKNVITTQSYYGSIKHFWSPPANQAPSWVLAWKTGTLELDGLGDSRVGCSLWVLLSLSFLISKVRVDPRGTVVRSK